MPSVIDFDRENPSPQMLEMGRDFGAWFRAALTKANVPGVRTLTIASLAKEYGIGKSTLYYWRDNCLDGYKHFRRPSAGQIKKVAAALGANAADGLRAMGYDGQRERFASVPEALLNLTPEKQQALAQMVELLQNNPSTNATQENEKASFVEPEAQHFMEMFQSLPAALRKIATEQLAALLRAAQDEPTDETVEPSE